MGKRLLPRRWWEWAIVALFGLLLYALFAPVYAYSGPGLSHRRIARELVSYRLVHQRWATAESDYALGRVPRGRSYSYRLEATLPRLAVYRIVVDDKPEVWMANESGEIGKLAVESITPAPVRPSPRAKEARGRP